MKIDIVGNPFDHTQYGHLVRSLIRYLGPKYDINIPVFNMNQPTPMLSQKEIMEFSQYSKGQRLPDTILFCDYPINWMPNPSSRNIGILIWPTTRIPNRSMLLPNLGIHPDRANFVNTANHMNEIWVFSSYAEMVARHSGITVPIKVIKPLLDRKLWDKDAQELDRGILDVTHNGSGAFIEKANRPYVIGTIIEWSVKANIEAFITAGLVSIPSDKSIVVLKINKAPNIQSAEIIEYINRLKNSLKLPILPKIVYIDDIYSDEETCGLLKTFDLYVSTSRGEGVDYNALHAMAMDKPVILPNHTWYENINCTKIPCTTSVVRLADEFWFQGDQTWGTVDEVLLIEAIKQCYNKPPPLVSVNDYDLQYSGGKLVKLINAS